MGSVGNNILHCIPEVCRERSLVFLPSIQEIKMSEAMDMLTSLIVVESFHNVHEHQNIMMYTLNLYVFYFSSIPQ